MSRAIQYRPTDELLDRTPPRCHEAELGMLGCVLLDPKLAADIAVTPEDFTHAEARQILASMLAMRNAGRAVDAILLLDELVTDCGETKSHWNTELYATQQLAPTPQHFADYQRLVIEHSRRRAAIQLGEALIRAGYERDDSTAEIDEALERINRVGITSHAPRELSVIDSAAFAAGDFRQTYLCRKILVAGQPGLIGGPAKSLKTGLMLDLGLSLGTATPFLGHDDFACEVQKHVAIFSGESGPFVLQETARRQARAKGIDLAKATVDWGFTLPKLACPEELQALQETITRRGIEVLCIDPAYLSLMAGDSAAGRQSSNVFDMGGLLMPLTSIGQATGCTIILAHHFKKGVTEPYGQPELEDLSMAGFLEWARQWALLRRREPYEDGSGQHHLWLRSGGSAGFSGLWAIDIDEGQLADDFTGRVWDVTVSTGRAAKADQQQQRERRKAEQQEKREGEHIDKLVEAMRTIPAGDTQRRFRDLSGLSTKDAERAMMRLVKDKRAEIIDLKKGNGRSYEGYRLI